MCTWGNFLSINHLYIVSFLYGKNHIVLLNMRCKPTGKGPINVYVNPLSDNKIHKSSFHNRNNICQPRLFLVLSTLKYCARQQKRIRTRLKNVTLFCDTVGPLRCNRWMHHAFTLKAFEYQSESSINLTSMHFYRQTYLFSLGYILLFTYFTIFLD